MYTRSAAARIFVASSTGVAVLVDAPLDIGGGQALARIADPPSGAKVPAIRRAGQQVDDEAWGV
jgi:hypothetical protein